MAVGLEVYNDAGALIIDSNAPNYSLLASGTVANDTPVSFPSTPVRPLVFVRFNTANRFVRISSLTSDSVTFKIYDEPAASTTYATEVSGSTEYMVFGVASTLAPVSNFGLNVFDAAGNLVFDSNRVVPRVKQVVSVPAPAAPAGTFNPISVVGHSQSSNPWMLANSTFNYFGYVYHDDNPAHLSYLMPLAIRSDDTGSGKRIMLEAVKGAPIGSQGSTWPNVPTQIALIP